MEKTGFIKRASLSLSANNLLLFTNYKEILRLLLPIAGVGGSSSVGLPIVMFLHIRYDIRSKLDILTNGQ